jgi:hypothetical protein
MEDERLCEKAAQEWLAEQGITAVLRHYRKLGKGPAYTNGGRGALYLKEDIQAWLADGYHGHLRVDHATLARTTLGRWIKAQGLTPQGFAERADLLPPGRYLYPFLGLSNAATRLRGVPGIDVVRLISLETGIDMDTLIIDAERARNGTDKA